MIGERLVSTVCATGTTCVFHEPVCVVPGSKRGDDMETDLRPLHGPQAGSIGGVLVACDGLLAAPRAIGDFMRVQVILR